MSHIRMIVDLMQTNHNVQARFLTYDGYLGAIGAFMNDFVWLITYNDGRQTTFNEVEFFFGGDSKSDISP